jgi:hypothetical protein
MRKPLRTILLAMVAVVALAFAATAVAAPHFQSATSSVNNDGALVVNFDERGLRNLNVNLTLTADATAVYACINGGGKHPQAANKETVQGQLTAGASFEPKNGRVVASLQTGPLSAGDFSCPSGQRLVLASVSYTNIVLTDTSNNVSTSVADASRIFFEV